MCVYMYVCVWGQERERVKVYLTSFFKIFGFYYFFVMFKDEHKSISQRISIIINLLFHNSDMSCVL